MPLLTKTVTERCSYGLAAVIVPWNYPLTLFVTDAVPALVAGNAVLAMPDRQTSFTGLWAARLLREAGVPPDALQLVTGEGGELGPAVVDHADLVLFTGSTATGRRVAVQAAGRLVPSSLELGGKNAIVVTDDVDLARTVEGIVRGCFAGAGQVCISFERIFVHARIYDSLVLRLIDRTRALRLGCSFDWDIDVGTLAGPRQLARVEAHVGDATARGARVLTGARRRPEIGPFVYEPTLLTDVTPQMALFAEETFGPVAAIYRVRDDEEAVARANQSEYGLTASVWSRDAGRALRIARRIDAGAVNINEGYGAAWGSVDSPASGWKASGPGHRHGRAALEVVTRTRTIARQRLFPIAPTDRLPPREFARLLTALLRIVRWLPGLR